MVIVVLNDLLVLDVQLLYLLLVFIFAYFQYGVFPLHGIYRHIFKSILSALLILMTMGCVICEEMRAVPSYCI